MRSCLFVCALFAAFWVEPVSSSIIQQTHFLQHNAQVLEAQTAVAVGEPEGGTAPLVPQHVVEWSEESKVPKVIQFLLASLWVCMLGSLPFIIRSVDRHPVTKTQIVVGVLELVVLVGGFWLFTNIILFQSIHFKRVRPLTVVECIYFMSQVITTVGYGDITPAKIRGQVFVGLYVLGALFIIAMLISDLTKHMIHIADEYKTRIARERSQAIGEDTESVTTPTGDSLSARTKSVLALITPPRPSLQPLLVALAIFGVLDVCWILFFSLHPGEGKTMFQALYMSVITLSSVGFGYFTPVTEEGMIFGAFWMLFGSCALVNVISQFTVLMVKMNAYERFHPKEGGAHALDVLKTVAGDTTRVTEAEFMQFILLQLKMVPKDDLEGIMHAFNNLKPKGGVVNLKAIEDSLKEEEPTS